MIQLRSHIESLDCQNLDTQKIHLLTLVDSLSAIVPADANGNGNVVRQHQKLSPREKEVMGMILDGRRLKEIASTLDISVKTVTTHRSRLLKKLGLEDNLGLYRYGVRNGLIAL
jgi:DNA-binding CsgD family transcriptional regulator